MVLHDAAPWALVGISALGAVAQFAVGQWRLNELEKWRAESDRLRQGFIEWRGEINEKIRTLEKHDDER